MLIESLYQSPRRYRNRHMQTVLPTMFRSRVIVPYERERIPTPDGDFLDLDWLKREDQDLVIISHGLEGCSQSKYVLGMASALYQSGRDVLAWNFRGCGGEPNRHPYSYHSGKTEDLKTVIRHVLENTTYQNVFLVGFSVGGNISLKYLGEESGELPPTIRGALCFSVPCSLEGCADALRKLQNRIYMERFLLYLRSKIREKANRFPALVSTRGLRKIRDFHEFDGRYTAPLNGFSSAKEYWEAASCLPLLSRISVPTLLVTAADDPFLTPDCYPVELAREHEYFHLEVPCKGGHVGFLHDRIQSMYWSEHRAVQYFGELTHAGGLQVGESHLL